LIGFLIGLLVGGFLGVCAMAMLAMASREDEHSTHNYSGKEL